MGANIGLDSTSGSAFESVVVTSSKSGFPDLSFKTIRLSCESDPYMPGKNYAGFILYGLKRDGVVLQDWWLNGKHCKSAYLIIQQTDPDMLKKYDDAKGVVHGAIYKNVFGKEAKETDAIGEGFSLLDGTFKWNSATFNKAADSTDPYHDGQRGISSVMKKCLQKILDDWREESPLGKTYHVKELKLRLL